MKRTILVFFLLTVFCLSAMSFAQSKPTVSKNYLAAQEALAADDMAKAKTALTALSGEAAGDVKTLAKTAADAKDLAGMRAAFKPLSEAVIKMQLPSGYAVAFCPMFQGGSSWVQKQGAIANPYYGKSMLTCGEFKKQ